MAEGSAHCYPVLDCDLTKVKVEVSDASYPDGKAKPTVKKELEADLLRMEEGEAKGTALVGNVQSLPVFDFNFRCIKCWTYNGPSYPADRFKDLPPWRFLELPPIPNNPKILNYDLSPDIVNAVRQAGKIRNFHLNWALHVMKIISYKFDMGSYAEKRVLLSFFGGWYCKFWPEYLPRLPSKPPNYPENDNFVSMFGLETVDGHLPRPIHVRSNAMHLSQGNQSLNSYRRANAHAWLYKKLVSRPAELWPDPIRFFLGPYWTCFYPEDVRMCLRLVDNDGIPMHTNADALSHSFT